MANSKVWCSGSTDSIPSLTPNSKIFDSSETMKVKLRWVSITPLGLPVVPEVKINDASASGLERLASLAPRSRSTARSGSVKTSENGQSLVVSPASAKAAASASPSLSRRSSPMRRPTAPEARATFTSSATLSSRSTGTTVAAALSTPK